MSKANSKSHPVQGDAPVIDPEAEVLEPLDAAMPVAENQPPSQFVPGNGITTLDVVEIALAYLMQLTGSTPTIEVGALRRQLMRADLVDVLSPEARRWMKPLA